MTKVEFALKVKEVSETLRSIVNDDGVFFHTSLYAFLQSAVFAMDLAVTRVNHDYVSDDLFEDFLRND